MIYSGCLAPALQGGVGHGCGGGVAPQQHFNPLALACRVAAAAGAPVGTEIEKHFLLFTNTVTVSWERDESDRWSESARAGEEREGRRAGEQEGFGGDGKQGAGGRANHPKPLGKL